MAKQTRINLDRSMTHKEVDRLKRPFELDLEAFYAALSDEVTEALEEGIEQGLTPDEIIEKIESMMQ